VADRVGSFLKWLGQTAEMGGAGIRRGSECSNAILGETHRHLSIKEGLKTAWGGARSSRARKLARVPSLQWVDSTHTQQVRWEDNEYLKEFPGDLQGLGRGENSGQIFSSSIRAGRGCKKKGQQKEILNLYGGEKSATISLYARSNFHGGRQTSRTPGRRDNEFKEREKLMRPSR